MFIDENEIMRRLNSQENLLNQLSSTDSPDKSADISQNTEQDTEPLAQPSELAKEVYALMAPPDINLGKEMSRAGRPKGARERSNQARAEIGVLGQVLGVGRAAELLGVSTASPSLHRKGMVNHDGAVDMDLKKEYKEKLADVRDKVTDLILETVQVTRDKELVHKISSAKEAAQVMSGLGQVLQRTLPKEDEGNNIAQFIIMQPQIATETEYDVIDV